MNVCLFLLLSCWFPLRRTEHYGARGPADLTNQRAFPSPWVRLRAGAAAIGPVFSKPILFNIARGSLAGLSKHVKR